MLAVVPLAAAQQFPAKPIHLVVNFAAGGAMDLTARSLYDDPHEMNNIFETSKARAELEQMLRSRPADAIPRLSQVGMA